MLKWWTLLKGKACALIYISQNLDTVLGATSGNEKVRKQLYTPVRAKVSIETKSLIVNHLSEINA